MGALAVTYPLCLQQEAPAEHTQSPVHLSADEMDFGLVWFVWAWFKTQRRWYKPEGKHPIALVWRAVKSTPIFQGGDEDFKPSHPIPGEHGNPSISLLEGIGEGGARLYAGVREICSLFIPSVHASLLRALEILHTFVVLLPLEMHLSWSHKGT